MGIITDYLRLQKQNEEKYGQRTVVLMQIGSFYEIYEYDVSSCTSDDAKVDKEGKVWNESIGHAIELSTTLNCCLTYENSDEPFSIRNPFKIGFPVISYE